MLSDLYVQNYKTLDEYYEKLDQGAIPVMRGVELNKDDQLRREVITELMCNFRLKKEKIESKYNIKFDAYFADALKTLKQFENDELVELADDQIAVTTAGRLLVRNIAMNFDFYLNRKEKNKPQFSRTV